MASLNGHTTLIRTTLTALFTAIILGVAGFAYSTQQKYSALHNKITLNHRLIQEEIRSSTQTCLQVEKVKHILNSQYRLQKRRSLQFLKVHPHGVDGITRQIIIQGIRDDEFNIRASNPSKC